jgi:hypothetical protein
MMRELNKKNKDLIRMLNRNQTYTLLKFHQHGGNLFSQLPKELIEIISNSPSPDRDVETLLEHVAFGEQVEAEAMIKANPRLLLYAGNTITPSGLELVRVTPYECALGGGDDRMAAMIKPYFSAKKIENGEKERDEQYERYRPHIENMLKQEPYDLQWLIDIIKGCSDEDIAAALKLDTQQMSEKLLNALTTFRDAHTPGKMVKPGMHFNYPSLLHAFDIYAREFDNLVHRDNYDKCRLVWLQVVCFEMRNLPAVDRQIFARGLYYVVENGVTAPRTFEFENDKGHHYPERRSKGYGSHSGFGFADGIDIFGERRAGQVVTLGSWARRFLENLCRAKTSNLQNLFSHSQRRTPGV